MPTRMRPRRNMTGAVAAIVAVLSLVTWAQRRNLPAFCDEAVIAMEADRPFSDLSLFYPHFESTLGILPVVSIMPIVHLSAPALR